LEDAGFDTNGNQENSDWHHLKSFVNQYLHAGEVKEKIEEYQEQLTKAMDFLMVRKIFLSESHLM